LNEVENIYNTLWQFYSEYHLPNSSESVNFYRIYDTDILAYFFSGTRCNFLLRKMQNRIHLFVSTRALDYLEKLVFQITYHMSSGS